MSYLNFHDIGSPQELVQRQEEFQAEYRISFMTQWFIDYCAALTEPPSATTCAVLFDIGNGLMDGTNGYFNNVLKAVISSAEHAAKLPGMQNFSQIAKAARAQIHDGRAEISGPRAGWEKIKL
ncbi:MAG: hypothetical protein ACD_40C00044G0002 [uncultured bacterium]|nr:MAG: hypothetical protein ACD_40C00044G0002 [uncultured bacterium]